MKLSVIIPIYNTEKYLQQSIESVIRQTYKDIEVILVDDGSTDGSGKICDQYAETYDNFKAIHQENGGNVAARCRGVEEAAGEYITFMDSDDWIAEDMYETLMKEAEMEGCDIISQSRYTAYEDGRYYLVETSTMLGSYKVKKDYDVFLSKMMYDEEEGRVGVGPTLGHKVIKSEIVADIVKKVDKNIVLGGDAAIFYSSCLRAKSICIIEGAGYFCRVRGMSVSRSYDVVYFDRVYTLYKYFENFFGDYDECYCLMTQLKKHLWHLLRIQIEQIFEMEFKSVYLFPYQLINKGSKIILYGAGKVGKSYNEQIRKNEYCNIAAWVDSNAYKENENIISPLEIAGLEYSRVVIAVKDKKIAEQIVNDLMVLGVAKDKIVWEEPVRMPCL
ncbi:hypothetical protein C807_02839 [Lachnospiraceae bacterium 28-4]|nr:hypothetical protein C807_02839 [Lachnospiraceae bacterium 28-4]